MSFSVQIRQWETPIVVEMGQTVLEAAIAQGVPYPHGCRSGNCGACKSRLLAGEVEMSEYSEYALTDDERAQGQILACSSVPVADCDVAWLDLEETVQHPMQTLNCTVTGVARGTHDIVILHLQALDDSTLAFSAGGRIWY